LIANSAGRKSEVRTGPHIRGGFYSLTSLGNGAPFLASGLTPTQACRIGRDWTDRRGRPLSIGRL